MLKLSLYCEISYPREPSERFSCFRGLTFLLDNRKFKEIRENILRRTTLLRDIISYDSLVDSSVVYNASSFY